MAHKEHLERMVVKDPEVHLALLVREESKENQEVQVKLDLQVDQANLAPVVSQVKGVPLVKEV